MAAVGIWIASAVTTAVTAVNTFFVAVAGAAFPSLSFASQVAVANVATKAVLYGTAALGAYTMLRPKVGAGGSPTDFKADPAAPICGVMGRFGVGGRQAHGNVWGKGNIYLSFATVLSLGPIQAVEGFTANEQAVTFTGAQGQSTADGPFKNKMWMTYRMGLPADAALSPPTGVSDGNPSMSEWTSSHRIPQFAHSFWTMRNNSKNEGFEQGVPKPQWRLRGMKVWDPRYDSTYPGGSGPQRRNDWRTWEWSENPQIHALAWIRGHHKLNLDGTIDRTTRLAGVGAPDEAIDITAFTDGANVSDINGWKIAGEWSTQDDKWQTLAAMLQAGGAIPINRGAQISMRVTTPRAVIYDLTSEDLAGPVNVNVMTTRRNRINTIVPRYRSESHNWEQVAAGPVTSSTYVAEDRGEPRTREVAYNFVRLAKQAAELAAYDIANAREGLTATIPCKPHLLNLRVGDALTVTVPEVGLAGQKVIILRRTFEPTTCVVTLEVCSETDGKHAWALGQAANPPTTPALTAVDVVPPTPEAGEWTIQPISATPAGSQVSGLELLGTPPDAAVEVLIEVGATAEGPWDAIFKGPSPTGAIPATGLRSGAVYYARITYYNALGVASVPLVSGPHTASPLVAEDVAASAPTITRIEADIASWEGALNSETTAREDQFKLLAGVRPNMIPNGNFEKGNGDGWLLPEGFGVGQVPKQGGWIAYGELNTGTTRYVGSPLAEVSTESAAMSGQIAYRMGSDDWVGAAVIFYDAAYEYIGQTPWRTLEQSLEWTHWTEEGLTSPAGAKWARVQLVTNGTSGYINLRQAKLEMGERCTPYTPDASVSDLAATVSAHSLSIIDQQQRNAMASLELAAVASGGMPALFRLLSSNLGSYAALIAPVVALMNNTPEGTPLVAMEARYGEVFFPRPVYIDLGGQRLIVGPGNGWVLWFGPDAIAASSATRTNGYFALGTDGKVYRGSSELPGGGTGGALAVGPAVATGGSGIPATNWSTLVTVSFSNLPEGGRLELPLMITTPAGAAVSDGGEFNGELRIIERVGSTTSVIHGPVPFIATTSGSRVMLSYEGPVGMLAKALSGAVNIDVQIRRASGSNTISGLRGNLSAKWTAQG